MRLLTAAHVRNVSKDAAQHSLRLTATLTATQVDFGGLPWTHGIQRPASFLAVRDVNRHTWTYRIELLIRGSGVRVTQRVLEKAKKNQRVRRYAVPPASLVLLLMGHW
jgi:hypothetical protein